MADEFFQRCGQPGGVAGEPLAEELGAWRADEFIDPPDATSATPVVMDAPYLNNGGQNFSVWLRHH